jgi:hypothetical protein
MKVDMINNTLEARFNSALRKIRQEGVRVKRNLSRDQADVWIADKDVALFHYCNETGHMITFWRGLPYYKESIDMREWRYHRRPYWGQEPMDIALFNTKGMTQELYNKVLQIFSHLGIVVEWTGGLNGVIIVNFAQSTDPATRA